MKRFIYHIMLFTALLQPLVMRAATADSVQVEHRSVWNIIYAESRHNPSMMATAFSTAMTEFYVTADYSHKTDRMVLQQGDGHLLPEAKATSYIRLSDRTAVWGEAAYMNGKTYNVIWNSVADYDLLKPDILGDTIGGDTRRERYAFRGGYATHLNRWRVGGEMVFRAEQEFRKVDPRMRSIVSDLSLRAGAAYDISTHYAAAFAVQADIYRQTNSVDFYKPLGSIPEYQLMGLGETYTRFSGDINDLYFRGGGIALQGDLQTLDSKGLFATVRLARHSYERVARLLNSLPLTTQYHHDISASLGWRREGYHNVALFGSFSYQKRSTDQHIAGTSSSQVYPVIATLTMYKAHTADASLTTLYGVRSKNTWYISTTWGYNAFRSQFEYPEREMRYAHFYGDVKGQLIFAPAERLTLNCQLGGAWRFNTSKRLRLPYADMEQHFTDMLEHNYRFLSCGSGEADASVRADYRFAASAYSIFAEAGGGVMFCTEDESQSRLHVTIGLTF